MQHRYRSLTPETYSLETTLAVLESPWRRSVVGVLADRNAPISLRGLASAVASRNADPGPDERGESEAEPESSSRPKDVAVELHHHHLPVLDDLGVVAYDHEARLVTPVDAEAFVPAVEAAASGDL